jgi:hypothetical protein
MIKLTREISGEPPTTQVSNALLLSTNPLAQSTFAGGAISMPLMRDRIVGYDTEGMAFEFTMLNNGETVECTISGAAMDELAGKKGTLPAEREVQFLSLRDAIERIASDNFDSEIPVKGGVVRIFAKHVQK